VEKEEAGRNESWMPACVGSTSSHKADASAGLDAWIRPKILLILALSAARVPRTFAPPTILVLGSLRQGIPWGIGFVEGDDPVAHADGRRRRTP
jgi:hypothetical protein